MMRLSKKLIYAIEAVLDIAWNGATQPVRSVEITERQDIPRRYLEQVLQALVRDGVLRGQRGPRGGYQLNRPKEQITLAEIVRIVQDLETAEDALGVSLQSELGTKVVEPIWLDLTEALFARLRDITVQDLCQKAAAAGVQRTSAAPLDFTI